MASRLARFFATLATALVVLPQAASAQAELTGTYLRYAGMGSDGTLINSTNHSFQYTESGSTPYSCDLFYPGSPVEELTVEATGTSTFSLSNGQSTDELTTLSGPTVSGRSISWSGRASSGSNQITVSQELTFYSSDRYATLTVTLTNTGSTSLTNVYYMRNGDPDHGSCGIGSATSTNNDVRLQPPTDSSALVTASAGSPSVVVGIGSHDSRARAHAGGFNNTDASGTWTSPSDPAGASDDIGVAIAFRASSLSIGASTTFVIHYVFGSSASTVESRFAALSSGGGCVSDGTSCTAGGESGTCRDGSCCTGCWDSSFCRSGTSASDCGEGGYWCDTCDDSNSCTTDSCSFGACDYTPRTGSSCDDGAWCTTGDSCNSSGVCVGGSPRSCDDGDTCTVDSCDEGADSCSYEDTGSCGGGEDAGTGGGGEDAGTGGGGDDAGTGGGGDTDGGAMTGGDGGVGGDDIRDPGRTRGRRGGCAVTPGAGSPDATWALLLLPLVSMLRRRRRAE